MAVTILEKASYPFTEVQGVWMFSTQLETTLVVGQEYTVTLQGITYTRTAQFGAGSLGSGVVLGNGAYIGLPNTGEPFMISVSAAGEMAMLVESGADSYEVGITTESIFKLETMGALLATQTYDGFFLHPTFQVYGKLLDRRLNLTPGERYFVYWDDTVFLCTAHDVSALMGVGALALGNLRGFGFESGNNEPFVFVAFPEDYPMIAALTDTEAGGSHTLGIFSQDVSVVLLNRDGVGIPYSGVKTVRLMTADGKTKDFSSVSSVESTVELDFSGGDMVVTPEAGELFSKLNILQPETLKDFNIAKGVEIAGIIGTFAGGGANVKIAAGVLGQNSSTTTTITHNLGIIPDIIIYYGGIAHTLNTKGALVGFATSEAFAQQTGVGGMYSFCRVTKTVGGQSVSNTFSDYSEEEEYVTYNISSVSQIGRATETTFAIGASSTYPVYKGTIWIAIGGLFQ